MTMRYGLIGKWFNKGSLAGFFVIDDSGKRMFISKDKTIQLAESGSLVNWSVVTDDSGEKHLIGQGISLIDIPTMIKDDFDNLVLVTKVEDENGLFGYVCLDNKGNKHNFKMNKVWDVAKAGRIDGVKAKRSSTNRVLESDDLRLRNLPTIKYKY